MSQIPRIQKSQLSPKVFSVGVVQPEGPSTGLVPPANLNGYETLQGNFSLYYRGKKFATAYELVKINNKNIVKEVAVYVIAMLEAAKQDGIDLRVTSGFRTMKEQADLFNINKTTTTILASKPGYSTHQTGIAVDFNVFEKQGKVYEWLVKNAYRFGFIRTIPSERWHWEYWGKWPGQKRPDWVGGARNQKNRLNHSRLSMFSKVPKYHSCGDRKSGGKFIMMSSGWWTSHGAANGHTDSTTNGATNSWIGFTDEFLPDKLDRQDPTWDKRKF